MSGTEVEVFHPRAQAAAALPAKIQYAEKLAASGLLPSAYRRQPANILYAIEYGDMLGLSPMAAITGIHVIEGKPTASAGLISALVRRAGHKLRVTGDDNQATCEIVRADDPSYTFKVTFTMSDAAKAGLANKDVWRKYGASMLKARAITQCARDACEEALFGLHYTPEEIGAEVDEDGSLVGEIVTEPGNGQQPASQPEAQEAPPPEDPWIVREAPEDWTDTTVALVPSLKDKGALSDLYKDAVAKRDAGEITAAQKDRVCELITARVEELSAPPVEGTVSAPDGDPWQAKIQEITSEDDAARVREELDAQHKGGVLDSRRHKALCVAIRNKVATLPKVAA